MYDNFLFFTKGTCQCHTLSVHGAVDLIRPSLRHAEVGIISIETTIAVQIGTHAFAKYSLRRSQISEVTLRPRNAYMCNFGRASSWLFDECIQELVDKLVLYCDYSSEWVLQEMSEAK